MGPVSVLPSSLSLVDTTAVFCRGKKTTNGDHKAWGQVQAPPLTGCVIWECCLTILALILHLQNAAWQLLCLLYGVVSSYVGWDGGAEDSLRARGGAATPPPCCAAGQAEGISASAVAVPSACVALVCCRQLTAQLEECVLWGPRARVHSALEVF